MHVIRTNVGPRIAIRPLADGMVMCAEGVEYMAECGCLLVFGVRLDDNEKSCGYNPCDRHRPHADAFLERLLAPEGRDVPTEEWMGRLLGTA